MGAIHFSINTELVTLLAERLGLECFVETGTYKGDSVRLVMDQFPQIHTVEISPSLHQKAQAEFASTKHVHLAHRHSPDYLQEKATEFERWPTLFWLDAHWHAADESSAQVSQCPLLDELQAIQRLHPRSVVMIDDARYFLAPPPAPHYFSQWPRLRAVIHALERLSGSHEISIFDDVIHFYPFEALETVETYSRNHGFDLLKATHLLKMSNVEGLHQELVAKETVIQELVRENSRLRSNQAGVMHA